jgi:hypothetical protein
MLRRIAADRRQEGRVSQRIHILQRCARRQNPDDDVSLVIEPDRAARQRVAAAHPSPVAIGHNCLIEAVALIAGRREILPQSQGKTQRAQKVL